jgi:flagellar hook-associated protein 1 FlgK
VKPYSAVDLRDQRQAKLEELAQYIDIQFENIPDGLGQIKVTTKVGDNTVTLVDGKNVTGQTIDADTDKIEGPFEYLAASRSFTLQGNAAATADLAAGKLKGQVEAATDKVAEARDEIENLAKQLVFSVNSIYKDNVGKPGDPTVFFNPTPAAGLKIELNTNITTDNLNASDKATGGNKIALGIAALASAQFTKNPTAGQPPHISGSYTSYFNKTVTIVAQELNSTRIRLEDQQLSEEMARNSREQYSGVSQDEEVTDMMKFQRSFQASARHINVIDTLLEQVVNRLGVG